jgi:hypothetical protein
MSGIGITFAVAGWVLFRVALLGFIGLLVVGLDLTERADTAAGQPPRPSLTGTQWR